MLFGSFHPFINSETGMSSVFFYHLTRQPLAVVLPVLLDKTLQKGWRAVVQTSDEERAEALSSQLWSWRDEAFLPHGTKADGHAEDQPIWLTTTEERPNKADVRFLVDGATLDDMSGYERVIYMFDGNDEEAVLTARSEWKRVVASDFEATYWQQDEAGQWQKKA